MPLLFKIFERIKSQRLKHVDQLLYVYVFVKMFLKYVTGIFFIFFQSSKLYALNFSYGLQAFYHNSTVIIISDYFSAIFDVVDPNVFIQFETDSSQSWIYTWV